jgi:hypothetical protein
MTVNLLIGFMVFILFNFTSSSVVIFKDEKKRIMNRYNLRAFETCKNGFLLISHVVNMLPVESMLSLDPIVFFKAMQQDMDDFFQITFWNTLDSLTMFHYLKWTDSKTCREFINQIIINGYGKRITLSIVYHFKVYLMYRFVSFKGNREELLNEARGFYTLRLRFILQKIANGKEGIIHPFQVEDLNRNFLFYYKCINRANVKSILISEFYGLKRAIKTGNDKLIDFHSENMTFLAGGLVTERSTVCGLKMIFDLPQDLTVYFMLMQVHRRAFLKKVNSIRLVWKKNWRFELLLHLYKIIPIFEVPPSIQVPSSVKFKLKRDIVNGYGEFLTDARLVEIAKVLFYNIISFEPNVNIARFT